MKTLLLAATILAGGAQLHQAAAQTPATASSVQVFPPPGPPPGPWGPPGMKGHHHGEDAAFSLFPPTPNKNLTAADVRIIAQATLLEHGNHSWTVTNVSAAGGKIDFSYASPHGDIIATFAVDPATGRIHRLS